MKRFWIVFAKEVTETLRDRRALAMLGLFAVMYPALLWLMMTKIINDATKADRETTEIVVIGAEHVPTLIGVIEQNGMTVDRRADMNEEEITALLGKRRHAAVVRVAPDFTSDYASMRPGRIELWFDSARDERAKVRRLKSALGAYSSTIAQARLLAHGVSPAALTPVRLQEYDTASGASRSANLIGMMLGMFFVTAFLISLNTAMDTTAGERERRSLELLLAQPVHPAELIAGKWIATSSLAVVGLTIELLLAHVILKWTPLEEIGMAWSLGYADLALVCLISIPLCLFAAAIEIALAMNARSFKEAQTMMSFAVLVPMIPALVVPMLDLKTAEWMYAVPVLAHQTLLNELAKGHAVPALAWLATGASSLFYAGLAVAFSTYRLKSERYVLSV